MKRFDFTIANKPQLEFTEGREALLRTQLKQSLKSAIGNINKGLKPSFEDLQAVNAIIEGVQTEGDAALCRYALAFDQFEALTGKDFLVTAAEVEEGKSQVSGSLKQIIQTSRDNIFAYHQNQKSLDWSFSPKEGIVLGQKIKPLRRVALYIPGGKAAYPSTVLMNGIPALIAGVEEIVLFTPPDKSGKVNPLVLFAADLLGIREIYKLGGAQAVAAAAYGTETIEAVDKIVGPGNRYVALAKKLVFGDVAIDMIAGPSEVLIVADESANPKWIAADLLAQAEHDEDAALYLITTDPSLPDRVELELALQLTTLPKSSIAGKAIQNNGYTFLISQLETGLILSNLIAPEHLELMVKDPFKTLDWVEHAGSVFLGSYTPEALGDYYAGTNHTLPTSGTARFSSPLGVYDFIKRPSFLSYTKEALEAIGSEVEAFAEAEGLSAHKRSVTYRLAPSTNQT